MVHRNARLTPTGRRLLCQRIAAGSPIAHVAAAMGISRQCASKWWHRFQEFGEAGLEDRPSDAYIHAAVDDHGRLAYIEVLDDEKGCTAAGFWRRAAAFFRAHGIVVERVMTDNAKSFLGVHFQQALAETGARHCRIPVRRPQVNGKVERFNRTLLEECAYAAVFRSDRARSRALARWVHSYNHHRPHSSLGGRPPISRVTNVPEDYN